MSRKISSKKHTNLDSRIPARAAGYQYVIAIPWKGQNKYWWNRACMDVLEVFGLPGGKFTSHPTEDSLEFYFKSKRDADLCQILLSEKL